MNRNEAIHVLEQISLIYPKAQMSAERVKILLPNLMEMDYDGVMKKLTQHATNHPYAPSIAEIAVYPKETNEHLELVKKWKAEAAAVSEQTKQRFHQALQKLILEKVHHEKQ